MSKKGKILITAPYFVPVVGEYRDLLADYDLIIPKVSERMSEKELLALAELPEIVGVIAGDDKWSRKVLSKAKSLRVLSKWGTGIDSFDRQACEEFGVEIKNTPNAFSEPVADTVIGLMLTFARNLQVMDRAIKNGIWEKVPGVSLRESVIGVIGVGNVGKAVVRRVIAFGGEVLGHDIVEPESEFVAETEIKMVSLDELLSKSDYVSLNCDLNESSFHLMGEKEFAQMKSSAVVINTARGPLIDEEALVWALENQIIAGVGLDVYEEEPLPKKSKLRKFDNVVLGSHNSNSSPMAWDRVHKNTVFNLLTVLEGKEKS